MNYDKFIDLLQCYNKLYLAALFDKWIGYCLACVSEPEISVPNKFLQCLFEWMNGVTGV